MTSLHAENAELRAENQRLRRRNAEIEKALGNLIAVVEDHYDGGGQG